MVGPTSGLGIWVLGPGLELRKDVQQGMLCPVLGKKSGSECERGCGAARGWKKVPCRSETLKPASPVLTSAKPGPCVPSRVPSPAHRPLLGKRVRWRLAPGRGRTRRAKLPPTTACGPPARRAGKEAPCMGLGREEVPCRAQGGSAIHGEGRAGGGEPAREGGRFRCLGLDPQRATPTSAPACRSVPAVGLDLRPTPFPATPHLRQGSFLYRSSGNWGLGRAERQGIQPGLEATVSRVEFPASPHTHSVTLGKTLSSLSLRFLLWG